MKPKLILSTAAAVITSAFLLLAKSSAMKGNGDSQSDQALRTERTVLGAGCFWCMEEIYEAVPGVVKVVSGYAGGTAQNPTYHQVGSGSTGHAEAIEIEYDPAQISYEKLLDIFWKTHDPTDPRGVSPDFGSQYRSLILPRDKQQLKIAEQSKARAQSQFKKPIATEIKLLEKFYPAEEYHQGYARKHPDDPYVRSVSQPRFERVNIPAILAGKQ